MKQIDVGGDTFVTYIPLKEEGLGSSTFEPTIATSDMIFQALKELDWIHHDKVPRKEYFCSTVGKPYAYGSAPYTRTYQPQAWTFELNWLKAWAERICQTQFEVCFLNYYETGKDQLNWHSDDSPEMDDARPIAIVTFGAEREIWFRVRPEQADEDTMGIRMTLVLEHGSICIMPPGMQDTHQHRIPKAGIHNCGPRISLTFRGFVEPK